MKIAILHSRLMEEKSLDDLDTLVQAQEISDALQEMGHNVIICSFEENEGAFARIIGTVGPDLVFNLVETVNNSCKNLYLAAKYLENLKIPFTGSNSLSLEKSTSKISTKKILTDNMLPTPFFFYPQVQKAENGENGNIIDKADIGNQDGLFHCENFNFPEKFIIKSVYEHASFGLSEDSVIMAGNKEILSEKVGHFSRKFKGPFFAEKFIEGKEYNIALLEIGGKAHILPCAQMVFQDFSGPEILDYSAKWQTSSENYRKSYRCFEINKNPSPLLSEMQDLALKCWSHFHISGYARVDFRVDKDDMPNILEVNTNPCLSKDGGFMAATEKGGFRYAEILEYLIRAALEKNGK